MKYNMKYLKRFNESLSDDTRNNKKFCGECGNKLDLNDSFCDECGEKQEKLEETNNEKYFTGKLIIKPFAIGSKSEGLRAYLEISGKQYILYRKSEWEGNVSYFEPYVDQNVSILGELQNNKFIMVKTIQSIK